MAKNKVYIDTSALVAYLRPADSCHKKAVKVWERLRKDQPNLILTNYILAEFFTVIRQRIGIKAAVKAGEIIKRSSYFKIIWADQVLDEEAWKIFKKNTQKNISFVDCVSIAVIEKLKINAVFGFDKHLVKAGVKLIEN
ncbi:MAG: PIN domain-containing protein [Candidatus Shapirobacteria bacterium]